MIWILGILYFIYCGWSERRDERLAREARDRENVEYLIRLERRSHKIHEENKKLFASYKY